MNISFDAVITAIGPITLVKLPSHISQQLPSRGMVMVSGTLNGHTVTLALEPDGKGSHWFEVADWIKKETGLADGDTVSLDLSVLSEWTEPETPADMLSVIQRGGLMDQWLSLTTKARWEWLRWIRSTNNPETRAKRIDVACSKLAKGDRRPCCFDTSRCTVPEVSKSGVLIK